MGRHEEGPHIADPTRGQGARCMQEGQEELSEAEQADYKVVKEKLIKLWPAGFVLLDNFRTQNLRQDESPTLFQHELKKALKWVMPGIDTVTCDQLLVHQFLLGQPIRINRQLWATGETTDLAGVLDWALLLMNLEKQEHNSTTVAESSISIYCIA